MTGGQAADPAAPIVGVVGCGVTGGRVVGHLLSRGLRVATYDPSPGPMARRAGVVRVDDPDDLLTCDAVVLCRPKPHARLAQTYLSGGVPVVSISDDLDDVVALTELRSLAEQQGVALIVGAGMAPGLSGLLARHVADQVHVVDELHVAIHGTAGPACAHQHHEALGASSLGWHDGEWIDPPGGSGRDLVWFPEPVGAHDCYRAAVADPLLLHDAFPQVQRISARVSATRRDRLTARLPMLAPPHPAGDLGSVRVEARGANERGERVAVIAGASGPTSELAAAVCAAVALQLVHRGVAPGLHSPGAASLLDLDLLHHATTLGVRVQAYTGVARPVSW